MHILGLLLFSFALLVPLYWYGPMVLNELAAVLVGYPGAFALVAMALALCLSLRLRWMQWLFGGLREAHIAQRWLVAVASMSIGLHHGTASLFGGDSLVAGLVGMIGTWPFYGLLSFLIVLSAVQIPYTGWRWLFGAIGIFFVAIAVLAGLVLLPYSSGDPLVLYLAGLSVFGFLCFVLSFLPFRMLEGRALYRIASLEPTGNAVAVSLEAEEYGISHQAGQYAMVRFSDDSSKKARILPISKRSEEDRSLRVSLPNDDDVLNTLQIDGLARVSAAFGHFFRDAEKPEIWIAGGTFVAPFVAFAQMLRDDSPPVDFFYCVANRDEAVHLQDLLNIDARYPAFQLHLIETDTDGDLTIDRIEAPVAAAMSEVTVYYCGPSDLRRSLRAGFLANGLKAQQFRTARYDLRAGIDLLTLPGMAWRALVAGIGRLFRKDPS